MILVTGAAGFVGRALTARLAARGCVRAATHAVPFAGHLPNLTAVHGKALSPDEDWSAALDGVGAVIHCAARVHVLRESGGEAWAAYRRTNVDGTLNLARQAVAAGARRFVFLSSIKVNGECTSPGQPFTEKHAPAPRDPYGVSKMEAEQGLRALARDSGLEVVIVRPPLVYGPGVKANFLSLMRWLARGWPLPLGALTENRRSLVALDNLVDLLLSCVDHPAAANRTFLVSDGEDLSTVDLLERLGAALGRPARLISVPVGALRLAAAGLGRADALNRLCQSLQVDMRQTRSTLGWTPPLGVDEGLRRAVVR
ncbi:MAG: SDR family oxidoreductase [Candidatus Accumulibacter sp.]|jgi:nucleoside-diphosphate-sugar epimerase|nr:SDR family oxidoreductase [Accumulibacter sp.]